MIVLQNNITHLRLVFIAAIVGCTANMDSILFYLLLHINEFKFKRLCNFIQRKVSQVFNVLITNTCNVTKLSWRFIFNNSIKNNLRRGGGG